MGLDYRIVLLLPAQAESRLYARLRQAGTLERTPFGLGATLDVPLDDPVFAFLADTVATLGGHRPVRPTPGLAGAYPHYFPTDETGRVGYWYVDTLPAAADTVYVRISAATSAMSRLLQHSPAVRQWVEVLCRELHAPAAFLDLEDEGLAFICRAGRPISATLDVEGHVRQAAPADQSFVMALGQEYRHLVEE